MSLLKPLLLTLAGGSLLAIIASVGIGWALGARGVTSLMVGGSFSDMALLEKFLGSDYHEPADEFSDKVPLGGAAEDADLHVALGRAFADTKRWPAK